MKLNHLGSLITFGDPPNETCLGYLMDFTGKGIYSPDGQVEITSEHAKAHNEALSKAELDGLDNNCQIGQCGTFYYSKNSNQVTTFIGTVVAVHVTVRGQVITFKRNSKTYRGRLQKDADCFNFKRIK